MPEASDHDSDRFARLQRPVRPDYAGRFVTVLVWSVILTIFGGGGYLVYSLGVVAYSDVHFLTDKNIASLPPGSTLLEARKQFNNIGMPFTLYIRYDSIPDLKLGRRIPDDLMSGRSENGWTNGRFTGFARWRDPERVAWGLFHEGFLVAPISVVAINDAEPVITQSHVLEATTRKVFALESVPTEEIQSVKISKRDPLQPALSTANSHVLPFDLKERRAEPHDIKAASSPLPTAAEDALSTGTDFVLFSLDPEEQENRDESQGFHGWKVLGSTPIQNQGTRTKLLTAFRAGVEENDGSVAGCFDPRHGIRVRHDGKTLDFVICFTCYSVARYVDGERQEAILITDSPRGVFDDVLKTANVPLPKPSSN
jgi:hypothetical protein